MRSAVTLPSGTVTFCFTDIEGSSMLLRSMGTEYQRMLQLHHSCLREVWQRFDGVEVNTEGDSFFVAFASPDRAIDAVAAAQRALTAESWPGGRQPLVRIGLHTGWARPVDGDYAALSVNQAARVVSAAHGGQVLVSDDTARGISEPHDPDRLVPLGRFRVRDFPEPVILHRLVIDGTDDRDLPPRVVPADGHNLVRPVTTFHGRRHDLVLLPELVLPGRMVTIVGPGGVGKTRLAIEHGLETATAWPDGVWFVDLAAATSPTQVDESVANAIGATQLPGRDLRVDLLAHLRDRSALIVLDNCEHLAPQPAQLAQDIVALAPNCAVLATSRAPLAMRGEVIHRLAPLELDGPDSPAFQLFMDRAGPSAPHDDDGYGLLCAALEGLPLSIELAAPRAVTLGARALLDRLDHSVALIKSADPSLPERHRTLERLLDWSWDLLTDDGRALLSAVAVLPAGFTLEMVEWAQPASSPRSDPVEALALLLDHSLVTRVPAAGETRFRMPVTVRTYALGRGGSDDAVAAARHFGEFFVARLGPRCATTWRWLSKVESELDNLRAVVHRVAGHDDLLGQQLAWSIGRHHDLRNAISTGTEEMATYLDLLPTPTPQRTANLCLMADLALRNEHSERVDHWISEARASAELADRPDWDSTCVEKAEGLLALRRDDPERAIEIARSAIEHSTTPRSRARLLNLIGIASAEQDRVDDAIDALRDELAAEEEAGLELMQCTTRNNLAEALLQAGDMEGAAQHQSDVLEESRSNQDATLVAFSVLVAARLCLAGGDAFEALVLQTAGARMLDDAGVVLFASDADALVAAATQIEQALDEIDHDRAAREGAALTPDGAADRAAAVLVRIASRGLGSMTTTRAATPQLIRTTTTNDGAKT
jgi:predicted ATPase/class 3 adenylate cyclase